MTFIFTCLLFIRVFCSKTGCISNFYVFANLAPRTPTLYTTYTSFNRIQFRSNNEILYSLTTSISNSRRRWKYLLKLFVAMKESFLFLWISYQLNFYRKRICLFYSSSLFLGSQKQLLHSTNTSSKVLLALDALFYGIDTFICWKWDDW